MYQNIELWMESTSSVLENLNLDQFIHNLKVDINNILPRTNFVVLFLSIIFKVYRWVYFKMNKMKIAFMIKFFLC